MPRIEKVNVANRATSKTNKEFVKVQEAKEELKKLLNSTPPCAVGYMLGKDGKYTLEVRKNYIEVPDNFKGFKVNQASLGPIRIQNKKINWFLNLL